MGMALSGCGYGEQTYHWCRTWESCPSSINGLFKSDYHTTWLAAGIFYYSWYSISIVTYNCNPRPWRCGISSIVEALKWQDITLCQKEGMCNLMHWTQLLNAENVVTSLLSMNSWWSLDSHHISCFELSACSSILQVLWIQALITFTSLN